MSEPGDAGGPTSDGAASETVRPRGPSRRLSPRARKLLRELHQRTWELEFLVSGALAFALGQLPGRVDDLFNGLFPRLSEAAGVSTMIGYQYVKLMLYTLILAFLLHIALRSFWVSLLGLDSIFPRGIRWNRLRLGPISQAYLRRHLPSVRELIVRTDAIASVVFAAAFYIVTIFLFSVVAIAALTLPLAALAAVAPWDLNPAFLLITVAVVASLIVTVPAVIDRSIGDSLDPDSRLARLIRTSHRLNLRMGMATYGPTQFTLTSQLGGGRAGVLLIGAMAALVGTFIVRDILLQGDRVRWSSLEFVPAIPGASGVDPRYYEAYWDHRPRALVMPSIPVDVLDQEATYVRLFVPFRPTRDPDVLDVSCPALAPLAPSGLRLIRRARGVDADLPAARIREALACASLLWEVEIDGVAVDADPVFATHPMSSLEGLAWYVDVRAMAPGRHVLTVRRGAEAHAVDHSDDEEEAAAPPRRHEIPFWR